MAGSVALRAFEPAHHEREWLKPYLTSNRSKLKSCNIAGCPCQAEKVAGAAAGGKRKRAVVPGSG